jgi:hypothetical protein
MEAKVRKAFASTPEIDSDTLHVSYVPLDFGGWRVAVSGTTQPSAGHRPFRFAGNLWCTTDPKKPFVADMNGQELYRDAQLEVAIACLPRAAVTDVPPTDHRASGNASTKS